MSLIGATSVTISAVFSLAALAQFFNPNAAINWAVIASYLMLVLVVLTLLIAIVRLLQVLINTGKLGKTRLPLLENNSRELRIAMIVLGIVCLILAIVSTMVIFMFAKKLNNVSYKLKSKFTESESSEEEENNWYEEACLINPNGTDCELCEPCSSRAACDGCIKKTRLCSRCQCDPKGGFGCGLLKIDFGAKDNSTEEKQGGLTKLKEFLGEPKEDSPCKDYLLAPKMRLCQLYELTNSWECDKNVSILQIDIPETINCIAEVVEEGATKRYIVAGLLIVSMLGHLVHLGVTIWCSGDESANPDRNYEYKVQEDENNKDDEGRGGEKEELAGEGC